MHQKVSAYCRGPESYDGTCLGGRTKALSVYLLCLLSCPSPVRLTRQLRSVYLHLSFSLTVPHGSIGQPCQGGYSIGEGMEMNETAQGAAVLVSLTVFVSTGSGWGHRPYYDCPAEQRAHRRSQGWNALRGAGPCPNSSWLRSLQQPSRLQHQPAKYVPFYYPEMCWNIHKSTVHKLMIIIKAQKLMSWKATFTIFNEKGNWNPRETGVKQMFTNSYAKLIISRKVELFAAPLNAFLGPGLLSSLLITT